MKIIQFTVNPNNGAIVVLCDDGSMWIHDGAVAASDKPWKPLPQPTHPKPKEDEDAITTTV